MVALENGQRTALIEIWAPGSSEATGEPNPAPVKIKDVWAFIYPQRSLERNMEMGRMALTTYRAQVDYMDGFDIAEPMFVRFQGKDFNIVGVLIDFATQKTVDLDLQQQVTGA
jgi:head-tail adaptor